MRTFAEVKSLFLLLMTSILLITNVLNANPVRTSSTVSFTTDTLRMQQIGCDSLYLEDIDSTLYESAEVQIPHYETETIDGKDTTYVDMLYIIDVQIFPSYHYEDTMSDTICSMMLPYNYFGNILREAGEHQVMIPTVNGCDSVSRLLNLVVFDNRRDTISLQACTVEFPITYTDEVYSLGVKFKEGGIFNISSASDEHGCPIMTTFDVTQYPVYNDTLDVDVCDHDIPFAVGDTLIETSGIYTFFYKTVHGCDSVVVMNLTVRESYSKTITINETVCQHNLPYVYGDSVFYKPGVYDFGLNTQYGCDSVKVHLKLDVTRTNYVDTTYVTVCSNELPYNYVIYDLGTEIFYICDTVGKYFIPTNDWFDCPDYHVLFLDTLPAYNDTLIVSVCQNELPYHFADSNFVESAIYTKFAKTVDGCDSLTTLVLTVNPSYEVLDTMDVQVCRNKLPYVYLDSAIMETGSYDFQLKTQIGCDSANVHLNFTVLENPQDTVTIYLCQNDFPIIYADSALDEPGAYDFVISDTVTFGCDTLRRLELIELPVYHDSISVSVCENMTYTIGDSILTAPGVYDIMLATQRGCDSLVTVTLNHYPTYRDDTLSFVHCENDLPFIYDGHEMNENGIYEIAYTTENGCDSIVPVKLTITPIIYNNDTIVKEICRNQLPYACFDTLLTEAGEFTFTTTSAVTMCDSVFYFKLIVHDNPAPVIIGNDFLCEGTETDLSVTETFASYRWNNGSANQIITIRQAGTYTVNVSNEYGCYGTVSKTVTAAALPSVSLDGPAGICKGDKATLTVSGGTDYVWNDGRTSASIDVYPDKTTNYQVTVYNELRCSREGSITVLVHELPAPTIAGRTVICQGDSTELVATGGTSYAWSTGVTGDRIVVKSNGNYSVTATDQFGCSNSVSQLITVNKLPDVKIYGLTEFCQNTSITVTAVGAQNYIWNSGETTASMTTHSPGMYTVTGTDANGCSSSASTELKISRIVASIEGKKGFCKGSSTTLTVKGDGLYTYRWDDGSTTQTIEVSNEGMHTVEVSNDLGCSSTLSANVVEYALPTPSIEGELTICDGKKSILRAKGGISYVWDDGSNKSYIEVTMSGTYSVTATNSDGCSAATSETVIVNPLPEIEMLSNTKVCKGDDVTIYAICNTAKSYQWTTLHSTPIITVTPTANTTYTVLVTDVNGCTNTKSTLIEVTQPPVPYIQGNLSFCQGDSTVLTAYGGNTYQWNTGQMGNMITVRTGGEYTVTVSNPKNESCTADAKVVVTENQLPVLTIDGKTSVCQGKTTELSATTSTACTYLWSNGSKQSSISISEAGKYSVVATNEKGCKSKDSTTVIINETPLVEILGKTSVCSGENAMLIAKTNSECDLLWSNNDSNDTIYVTKTDNYTVTATNVYGCTAQAAANVVIHALPVVDISGSNAVCRGNSAILTATGGVNYLWSNGSTTSDIAVYPNTTTTYSVVATDEFGCSASASKTITVNVLPSISFNGNRFLCEGGSTVISVPGGMSSYSWSTGLTTNSINITTPGMYYVTVTNSLGCSKRDSVEVVTSPNPVVEISGESLICDGNSQVLTATGAVSYKWNTGENSNTITVMPHTTTSYTVVGTDGNGCSSTVSKVVNVEALPDVKISGVLEFCYGNTSTLTATGGYKYLWSTGSTNPSIEVSQSGNYSVKATSANGCSASEIVSVQVSPTPTARISGNSTLCDNQTEILTAVGGTSYLWSNGAISESIQISKGGHYAVTVRNDYGCASEASIDVETLTAPFVKIIGENKICNGSVTTLIASSNASSFVWNTEQTTQSIIVSPPVNTEYAVTATNDNGCFAKDSIMVMVNPTYEIPLSASVCQGQPYKENGFDLPAQTTAGEFVHRKELQTIHGCDSVLVLTLNVKPLPVIDSIAGYDQIAAYGTYFYKIEKSSDVDSYEWRISNPKWTLSTNFMNSIFVDVTSSGSGTLFAKGINSCGYTEASINIKCPVGIEEYTNDTQILLYPNPIREVLYINFENTSVHVDKVQLYDNLGRCLQVLPVEDSLMSISCEEYAAGIYFVRFVDENGRISDTRKIVIRK